MECEKSREGLVCSRGIVATLYGRDGEGYCRMSARERDGSALYDQGRTGEERDYSRCH